MMRKFLCSEFPDDVTPAHTTYSMQMKKFWDEERTGISVFRFLSNCSTPCYCDTLHYPCQVARGGRERGLVYIIYLA